jgi:hypothetical protein
MGLLGDIFDHITFDGRSEEERRRDERSWRTTLIALNVIGAVSLVGTLAGSVYGIAHLAGKVKGGLRQNETLHHDVSEAFARHARDNPNAEGVTLKSGGVTMSGPVWSGYLCETDKGDGTRRCTGISCHKAFLKVTGGKETLILGPFFSDEWTETVFADGLPKTDSRVCVPGRKP